MRDGCFWLWKEKGKKLKRVVAFLHTRFSIPVICTNQYFLLNLSLSERMCGIYIRKQRGRRTNPIPTTPRMILYLILGGGVLQRELLCLGCYLGVGERREKDR